MKKFLICLCKTIITFGLGVIAVYLSIMLKK